MRLTAIFDLSANIEPIRTLLDQGYDLEADVVPIVARLLPDLPRPLKNRGAPWLGPRSVGGAPLLSILVSQQFGPARGSLSGHLLIGGWRRRMLVGTPAERVGDNSKLGVPPGHAP